MLNLIKICVRTCDKNSTLGSVVPLAMFHINEVGRIYIYHLSNHKTLLFQWVFQAHTHAADQHIFHLGSLTSLSFIRDWGKGNLLQRLITQSHHLLCLPLGQFHKRYQNLTVLKSSKHNQKRSEDPSS